MKIIESLLTKNDCYKAGKTITVKGMMLHSVGCPQPSASVFIKLWNKSGIQKCVHAFIDGNTGDIYQTLPWNRRGWHGGGSSNNTHIGVEMCEPACIKYTGGSSFTCSNLAEAKAVVKRTYEAAVKLFAARCKEFKLDPLADGVILSHKEGHARGIASNHGDPEHLWKQLDMGYTMNTFRQAVKAAMNDESVKPTTKDEPAKVPFTIKVDKVAKDDVLTIRKTPNARGVKTGSLQWNDPNSYTIVEEKNGWGKLKSGLGWINLHYTKTVNAVKTISEPVKKEIKPGSTVKVKKGAKTFNGGNLAPFVYERNHQVKEINVDRVVITYDGIVIAAVRKSDLIVI